MSEAGSHDHRRGDIGEVAGVELLVRVTKATRRVHDERGVDKVIKQEGQVQILRIERRVRADQYRIDCGEFDFGLTAEGVS